MSTAETDTIFLEYPTLDETEAALEHAIHTEQYITLVGTCRVEYEGRASSVLGWGDRHIVIKPDGVVLIHAPTLTRPKNYQPSGATVTPKFDPENETLELHAERVVSKKDDEIETIDITLSDVYFITGNQMIDEADFNLRGTEADMGQYLMENPDCVSEYLGVSFTPVERELKLDVGSVDVFGRTADSRPVLIELKRRRVGPKAVDQLYRYVAAYSETSADVLAVLAAPSMTPSAKEMLDSLGFIHLPLSPDDVMED